MTIGVLPIAGRPLTDTVFHEYLAGIIFSEFVILEISRVFNLAIPKNRAG